MKCEKVVPKAGVEPAHPGGRQNLNLVRLPFRHFGLSKRLSSFIEIRSRFYSVHIDPKRDEGRNQ